MNWRSLARWFLRTALVFVATSAWAETLVERVDTENGPVLVVELRGRSLSPFSPEGPFHPYSWQGVFFLGAPTEQVPRDGVVWQRFRAGSGFRCSRGGVGGLLETSPKSVRFELESRSSLVRSLNREHRIQQTYTVLPAQVTRAYGALLGKSVADSYACSESVRNIPGTDVPEADVALSLLAQDLSVGFLWGRGRSSGTYVWPTKPFWGYIRLRDGQGNDLVRKIYRFEPVERQRFVAWCRDNVRDQVTVRR